MNTLISLPEFQYLLNQFISIDRDLMPWKHTCTMCYYYKHKMHMKDLMCDALVFLIEFVDIVNLDFTKQVKYEHAGACGAYIASPQYGDDIFTSQFLPSITHLKLLHSRYRINDDHIACLTTLVYLDLGFDNRIHDAGIIPLVNLETLLLHGNNSVTPKILPYLPKLKTLQYSSGSKFSIELIPETVTSVTVKMYDYVCECCDNYQTCVDEKILR